MANPSEPITQNNAQDARAQNELLAAAAAQSAAERDQAVVSAAIHSDRRRTAEEESAFALSIAAEQAEERRRAEIQAQNAKIQAAQTAQYASHVDTERTVLRSQLETERESASNASFGFTLITSLVLATLLGLGIWYYVTNNDRSVAPPAQPSTSTNRDSGNLNGAAPAANRQENTRTVIIQTPPTVVHTPPVVVTTPPAHSSDPETVPRRHLPEQGDVKDTSGSGSDTDAPADKSGDDSSTRDSGAKPNTSDSGSRGTTDNSSSE